MLFFLLLCVCYHAMWPCEKVSLFYYRGLEHAAALFCLYKGCLYLCCAFLLLLCVCYYAMWPCEKLSLSYYEGMHFKGCCICAVLFSIVECLLSCYVTMRKCFHLFVGDAHRFFAYIRHVMFVFCIVIWLLLCYVTMRKTFLSFIVRGQSATLFCLHKGCCVYVAALFSIVVCLLLWKKLPRGEHATLFAYIRGCGLAALRIFCLYKEMVLPLLL
jgi:hypothetical protein